MKNKLWQAIFVCSLFFAVGAMGAYAQDSSPLPVVPRESWGAVLPDTARLLPLGPVNRLVVHHTAGSAPVPEREKMVLQAIQSFHVKDKRWGDIAYHFLIAPSGTIYEGRLEQFAGDSGTAYDLKGKVLVCLLGTYGKSIPTPAALDSLSRLLREKVKQYHLTLRDICGHRDLAATDCPGDRLYEWLARFLRLNPVQDAAGSGATFPVTGNEPSEN